MKTAVNRAFPNRRQKKTKKAPGKGTKKDPLEFSPGDMRVINDLQRAQHHLAQQDVRVREYDAGQIKVIDTSWIRMLSAKFVISVRPPGVVVHKWSEKVLRQLLLERELGTQSIEPGTPTKRGKQKKKDYEPEDPRQTMLDAAYVMGTRDPKVKDDLSKYTWASHVAWFKNGIEDQAMRHTNGKYSKPTIRGAVIFDAPHDGLIPMKCAPPDLFTMPVKVGPHNNRVVDIRHRPIFRAPCTIEMTCRYNATIISLKHLIELMILLGECGGIGDWRNQGRDSCGYSGFFDVIHASGQELIPKKPTIEPKIGASNGTEG